MGTRGLVGFYKDALRKQCIITMIVISAAWAKML